MNTRTQQNEPAPTPFTAGLMLIGMGMLWDAAKVQPARAFRAITMGLIWQWFGVRRYEQDKARGAWFFTGYLFVAIAITVKALKLWLS